MSKTVAIIQARLGSSRLPGKALRVLKKRPLIAHVIERVKAVGGIDSVIIATSTHEKDDKLVEECERLGVTVFRGSEQDVLGRMLGAAQQVEAEVILRITGDCPLLCPRIVEDVMALYWDMHGFAYAWNDVKTSGYPDGTDVEVFGIEMLDAADQFTHEAVEREHVTPFMRAQYRVETVRTDQIIQNVKLSVDTLDDYDFVTSVFKQLRGNDLTLPATMAAVDALTANVADTQG